MGLIFKLPRFLRRFIRKRTQKIPEERAERIKKQLSLAYAFVTWNLVGFVLYKCMYRTESTESGSNYSKPRWWEGNVLNIENAKHYRVEGFTITEVVKEEKKSEEL